MHARICLYISGAAAATRHLIIALSDPRHQHRTIAYHTLPYHTVPYHTIPYHTIPYCALMPIPASAHQLLELLMNNIEPVVHGCWISSRYEASCYMLCCGIPCHSLLCYGMIRYGMVRYNRVRYCKVPYDRVQYGMVWYSTVQYSMVWYGMVRHALAPTCCRTGRRSTRGPPSPRRPPPAPAAAPSCRYRSWSRNPPGGGLLPNLQCSVTESPCDSKEHKEPDML